MGWKFSLIHCKSKIILGIYLCYADLAAELPKEGCVVWGLVMGWADPALPSGSTCSCLLELLCKIRGNSHPTGLVCIKWCRFYGSDRRSHWEYTRCSINAHQQSRRGEGWLSRTGVTELGGSRPPSGVLAFSPLWWLLSHKNCFGGMQRQSVPPERWDRWAWVVDVCLWSPHSRDDVASVWSGHFWESSVHRD